MQEAAQQPILIKRTFSLTEKGSLRLANSLPAVSMNIFGNLFTLWFIPRLACPVPHRDGEARFRLSIFFHFRDGQV
jgi:hypothetical protein